MSYKKRASGDDSEDGKPFKATPRTDYRCIAHGCPNTGSIDDRGEKNRGKCYWHWSAPSSEWQAITEKIRRTPTMRNHGKVDMPLSKFAEEAQKKLRGDRPTGVINGSTGGRA